MFGHGKEKQAHEHQLLQTIVHNMTVQLNNPEDMIIKQHARTREMYVVAKGVCTINYRDERKQVNKN